MLTVEEAADVLRISRGVAYELARQWRATGGEEGLPVVELGRSLRVPKDALLEMLATGAGSPPLYEAGPDQRMNGARRSPSAPA